MKQKNKMDKTNLPYDPDLNPAALEKQEIFDKYKIGGSEWCAAQFGKKASKQPAIRVKSKKRTSNQGKNNTG